MEYATSDLVVGDSTVKTQSLSKALRSRACMRDPASRRAEPEALALPRDFYMSKNEPLRSPSVSEP